jgi:hypothetical protein
MLQKLIIPGLCYSYVPHTRMEISVNSSEKPNKAKNKIRTELYRFKRPFVVYNNILNVFMSTNDKYGKG